jgi:[ribosomal protein S18]-alanine N-acetyltransferase
MALLFGRNAEAVQPVLHAELDTSAYTIEPAQADDLATMDRIEREAFTTPWSLDLMRGALVNHRYRVRVLRADTSDVVGFYIAHTTDNQSNLDNLAITGASRRRGCGRRLVVDWVASARKQRLSALSLQVNTRNQPAERLYRTFSFRRVRLLSGYYPNGEDAYQMERDLVL